MSKITHLREVRKNYAIEKFNNFALDVTLDMRVSPNDIAELIEEMYVFLFTLEDCEDIQAALRKKRNERI